MKNTLKINHAEGKIVMDRTFAKLSEDTRSEEYAHLQAVRRDYPTYEVITKTTLCPQKGVQNFLHKIPAFSG